MGKAPSHQVTARSGGSFVKALQSGENVHPLNEPLDRCCQCTRHRFAGRTEHDLRTRAKQRMGAATGGRADERAQAAQAEAEVAAQMYRGSYQRASYRGGDLSRPLLRSV